MKLAKQLGILLVVSLISSAIALAAVYFGGFTIQSDGLPPEKKDPESSGDEQPTGADPTPQDEPKQAEPDPEAGAEEPPEEEPPEQELLDRSLGNGTCCVVGPGGIKTACVVIPSLSPEGERVVRIAPKAFFGCSGIAIVQIPETVREIGALAFADCKNLVYLSVDEQNPVYCDADGVLYTADQRVLVQYPPRRIGDPLVIPASVTAIQEMAFYQCKNLKSIVYEGSGEDWERIDIGSRNYALVAQPIRFERESA